MNDAQIENLIARMLALFEELQMPFNSVVVIARDVDRENDSNSMWVGHTGPLEDAVLTADLGKQELLRSWTAGREENIDRLLN